MWSCLCLQRGCSLVGTQFKTAKLSHLNITPFFGFRLSGSKNVKLIPENALSHGMRRSTGFGQALFKSRAWISFMGPPINYMALLYLRMDFTGIKGFLGDMVIEWAVPGVRDLFWVFSSLICCIIFIYSPNKYWAPMCWGLLCILRSHLFIASESFPFEEPETQRC